MTNKETVIKPLDNRFPTGNGGGKAFFSKLAKGLLIPIAILPVAGLLLGFGSQMTAIVDDIYEGGGMSEGLHEGLVILAQTMRYIGKAVFDNLGIIFAIAIAIAFTEDAGVAALSAVVMMFAMMAIQDPLIIDTGQTDQYGNTLYDALY